MTHAADFIHYQVTDADGTHIDQFSTNSADVARDRIGHWRRFHRDLVVTETPD